MTQLERREQRRYRKVLCRIYSDEKFQQLSDPQPNGKTLWIYLITGPHTTSVPGLFRAGEARLSEELGWPLRNFRAAWLEIESRGMAVADWKARVVWLPNAIKYNEPESPNVIRGWRHSLEDIPACALKASALLHLEAHVKGLGQAFAKAFDEVTRKPYPSPSGNQEQEQEQEQEPEQEQTSRFSIVR